MANKSQPTEIRENSADRERRHITREYIEERLRWQKTPEGIKALAEQEKRSAAAKAKAKPARFPELATRGTKPALVDIEIARMRLNNLIR